MNYRTIVAVLVLAANGFGEKLEEQKQKPIPLTEIQSLKFENLDLKAKPVQDAVAKIQAEYSALASAVCAEAQIPLEECRINPGDKPTEAGQPPRTVMRVPKPAAPPVQAPGANPERKK